MEEEHQPHHPSDSELDAHWPLQGLKLASHAVLEEAQQQGRLKCLKCGGSRMFFCYTCCSLVGVVENEVPSVKVRVEEHHCLDRRLLTVIRKINV